MMCEPCHRKGHIEFECDFPQSCTCQHRNPATASPEIGKEEEASKNASPLTAQELTANAADRLDT